MSLGPCPECGYQVSSNAESCPKCGNKDFLVRIGTVIAKCRYCVNGKVEDYSRVGPGKFDTTVECSFCKGSSKLEYVEFKDTRSGELYRKDPNGSIHKA